jgi:diacylglycerol kinase (ATP)
LYFIINLLAGGGKARQRWQDFSKRLAAQGFRIRCHATEYTGHAITLAAQALAEKVRRLYVFGGDGTLNEVLNGVIREDRLVAPQLQLVYLGAGSSCDVEKMFPERLSLVERINSQKKYAVDVVKICCHDAGGKSAVRYFLANSSIGVISESVVGFNQKTRFISFLKRLNVDVAALYAGLKNIFRFGNFHADLYIDQAVYPDRTLKNITVFKCAYFGGGMNYGVPSACDDGKLHIALINQMGSWRTLGFIPALYRGTVLKKSRAEYRQGNCIRIESPNHTVAIEADGEIIGRLPCTYTILPGLIQLIV